MKLSEIQLNVLECLNDNSYLYYQNGNIIGESIWLDVGCSPLLYINKNTYKSLLKRKLIQFVSSDMKNFSRRKYTISDNGKEILKGLK